MIPDEAVEAACDFLAGSNGGAFRPDREFVRKVLEAAAPHIAGVAWEEGRAAGFRDAYVDEEEEEANPHRSQS